jgi:hypothetical protein
MVILTESSFSTQVINESDASGKKNWFIEGVFMQSDVVNKNRRFYPDSIMESATNSYISEYVSTNRAVGELSHPESIQINLDKITHLIESINKDGKNYIGRAKVLNTPCGNIVSGLLEGGVQLGVSSRGLGSVTEKRGINEVQNDFIIKAIDIVYQPSAPIAFVDGLMEGASFIWDSIPEDTEYLESLKESIKNTKTVNLQEQKIVAFNKFLEKIKAK